MDGGVLIKRRMSMVIMITMMMAQHISGANFEYNTTKRGTSPNVLMYEVPSTESGVYVK